MSNVLDLVFFTEYSSLVVALVWEGGGVSEGKATCLCGTAFPTMRHSFGCESNSVVLNDISASAVVNVVGENLTSMYVEVMPLMSPLCGPTYMSGWGLVTSISYSKSTGQLLSIPTIYIIILLFNYLSIGLASLELLAHVDVVGEYLVQLGVDDGEGVHGDEDLVSLAVDADAVVVVLVLVVGRELHVQVLTYPRWYHPLLVVLDLEVWCVGRQDVEALGRRRVVDEAHFEGVSLVGFEAGELDDGRTGSEDAVRSHTVKSI